uniref:DUF3304 domain-containing protein n=1 Tax=Steinernema glaseri TaxID=37863 RepID=A0A1I8A1B1_9BILA
MRRVYRFRNDGQVGHFCDHEEPEPIGEEMRLWWRKNGIQPLGVGDLTQTFKNKWKVVLPTENNQKSYVTSKFSASDKLLLNARRCDPDLAANLNKEEGKLMHPKGSESHSRLECT